MGFSVSRASQYKFLYSFILKWTNLCILEIMDSSDRVSVYI